MRHYRTFWRTSLIKTSKRSSILLKPCKWENRLHVSTSIECFISECSWQAVAVQTDDGHTRQVILRLVHFSSGPEMVGALFLRVIWQHSRAETSESMGSKTVGGGVDKGQDRRYRCARASQACVHTWWRVCGHDVAVGLVLFQTTPPLQPPRKSCAEYQRAEGGTADLQRMLFPSSLALHS